MGWSRRERDIAIVDASTWVKARRRLACARGLSALAETVAQRQSNARAWILGKPRPRRRARGTTVAELAVACQRQCPRLARDWAARAFVGTRFPGPRHGPAERARHGDTGVTRWWSAGRRRCRRRAPATNKGRGLRLIYGRLIGGTRLTPGSTRVTRIGGDTYRRARGRQT